jgi:hypothetical protein
MRNLGQNPCFTCRVHRLGKDKKRQRKCMDCEKRTAYVASIGGMTHSVPDQMCDYRRFVGRRQIREA